MEMPDPQYDYGINAAALKILCSYEKLSLIAYDDGFGNPTMMWGETQGIKMGMTCTKAQADIRLAGEVNHLAAEVKHLTTVDPTENQLGGMVVLAYNIGLEAFTTSTVLKRHNAGDFTAAARAFTLFDKARNKKTRKLTVVPGLTSRRLEESALYAKPSEENIPPQPQSVAPETSMTTSPINVTSAMTAAGGTLTVVSTFSDQLQNIAHSLDSWAHTFGVSPPMILGGLLAAGGVFVIVQRILQRKGGWA